MFMCTFFLDPPVLASFALWSAHTPWGRIGAVGKLMVGNVAHPRQHHLFELGGVDFIAGSESSKGGQGLFGMFS